MKKLLKLKKNFLKSDLKDKYLDLLAFSNTDGDYGIVELRKSLLEPTVLHIFINGFTNDNQTNNEFDKWLNHKNLFSEQYDNLYGFQWPSGQNFEGHIKNNTFSKSGNIRDKLKEIFPKASDLSIALPILSIQTIAEWKNAKNNSEKYSLQLYTFIEKKLQDNPNIKINLYGHSLGANVIHHTLNKLVNSNLKIGNVYLFGGAVKNHKDSWDISLDGCKNLYNFYSKNDDVLSYMFRLVEIGSKPIGLFPIENLTQNSSSNLYNFDVTNLIDKHTSYIDNLNQLLTLVEI